MSMLKKVGHSFRLIKSTRASRCQGAPIYAGLIISSKLQDETHAAVTTQRITVETAGTECCNLFGQPIRHAGSVARSCSMHTSQSVGKSAHSSPDSRHPGCVGAANWRSSPGQNDHPSLCATSYSAGDVGELYQRRSTCLFSRCTAMQTTTPSGLGTSGNGR